VPIEPGESANGGVPKLGKEASLGRLLRGWWPVRGHSSPVVIGL